MFGLKIKSNIYNLSSLLRSLCFSACNICYVTNTEKDCNDACAFTDHYNFYALLEQSGQSVTSRRQQNLHYSTFN